jgi:hypothetical protein
MDRYGRLSRLSDARDMHCHCWSAAVAKPAHIRTSGQSSTESLTEYILRPSLEAGAILADFYTITVSGVAAGLRSCSSISRPNSRLLLHQYHGCSTPVGALIPWT